MFYFFRVPYLPRVSGIPLEEVMRRLSLLFVFLLVLAAVAGCSSIGVQTDYDPDADFSTIKTYAWAEDDSQAGELAENPLLRKRIRNSIDRYLAVRGFSLVDPARADVLLVIGVVVKEKMRVTDWGGPGGYYRNPWYDPWWGRGAYGGRVDVSYYHEGTLVIDIVDNAKKELIWRGLGTGIVQRFKDQAEKQAAVDKYVSEILDRFPPGHEKASSQSLCKNLFMDRNRV